MVGECSLTMLVSGSVYPPTFTQLSVHAKEPPGDAKMGLLGCLKRLARGPETPVPPMLDP